MSVIGCASSSASNKEEPLDGRSAEPKDAPAGQSNDGSPDVRLDVRTIDARPDDIGAPEVARRDREAGSDTQLGAWPGCGPTPDLGRSPYTPGVVAGCPQDCPASCLSCQVARDGGVPTQILACKSGATDAGLVYNCSVGAACDGPEDCPRGQVCVSLRSTFELGLSIRVCRDPAMEKTPIVPGDRPLRLCHADTDCPCDQQCRPSGSCMPR